MFRIILMGFFFRDIYKFYTGTRKTKIKYDRIFNTIVTHNVMGGVVFFLQKSLFIRLKKK